MKIVTVFPDGKHEERDLTDDEVAQIQADKQENLAAQWHEFRVNRNSLLAASDWTQAADAPVDKYAWAEYRQQLRDLPANTTDPSSPVWPTPPA